MNVTNIKIIKQSQVMTPPPPNMQRSRSREKKRRHKTSTPISLLAPSTGSLESVRSRSFDSRDSAKKRRKVKSEGKKVKKKNGRKRQSAIGIMFKKFSSKKKDADSYSVSEKNQNYHPQIAEIVSHKNKRNSRKIKKKTSEDLYNLNKKRNSSKIMLKEKVRSNSFDIGDQNDRKKTIV